MKKTFPLILFAIFTLLLLGSPERAFAQRGGHGGGGGFHSGGGGFHGGGGGGLHGGGGFRSGSGFRGAAGFRRNGFRGDGFRGGRGGRGWRGRGWGGRGWGWGGWGWGWGLGWGWPYDWDWPGYGYAYPYGYGYDSWPGYYGPSEDPNYDPYDDQQYTPPPARRYRDDRNTNPPPSTNPTDRDDRPLDTPSRDSVTPYGAPYGATNSDRPPGANAVTVTKAAFRSSASPRTTEAAITGTINSQLEKASAPHPEVLNAMRALREMPPYAREREIDHGRYSHFSPEERQLLRDVQ